jgi:hypothetical protein
MNRHAAMRILPPGCGDEGKYRDEEQEDDHKRNTDLVGREKDRRPQEVEDELGDGSV